ncbi:pyruvate decarboxylase, putative [Talaromyces stipitatus ATCC 10500]|uniref:Pyruvate decarboxylase n=1 Tax=Talaromyces stipitatus (strain ATCC 10500 / CBS 375.48 / QM 6759 / NRRL 1006) TaxID=441959 RepID=B8LZW4_TALSN|nr:pyruvate decarboxylase, putative [Talaromyces stipitatus ATCC 10500]EED20896.1 pyruvate decarboxylase, putative [Talaromyces stipitatus ATCC 10500]
MAIKIADYLFTRLRQLGVDSVFGVPGDYNLRLLDYVEPAGLHWSGNCNELNAAYAADGYARIKGLSALVTTFGVGELSAINGIAGAFTEKAPIVHIVGTPPRPKQEGRVLVHHTLGDGDYRHFANMAAHVTVAQANLTDPRLIPDQIDWVLKQAMVHSRPVYLEVPDDMPDVFVEAKNLETAIKLESAHQSESEKAALQQVLKKIYNAKQPLIIVDGDTRAMGITAEAEALVRMTGWPTWTTAFGRALINEQLPNVYGMYTGPFGDAVWKQYHDKADLIIILGPHYSDTNTSIFTTLPNPAVSVTFSINTIQIGDITYRDISNKSLQRLIDSLDGSHIPGAVGPPRPVITEKALDPSGCITQKHFWQKANRTSSYGSQTFSLPKNTRLFNAITWLSIGYMLPATLGATLAQRDRTKDDKTRAFLFIGDGSLQMSVQEISTMIREKLNIIIFVINNGGYTIERAIHGRNQKYNDVALWRHTQATSFFGADENHAKHNNFVIRNWGDLEEVVKSENVQGGSGVRVVEVFMERDDVRGALLPLMQARIANGD